MKAFLDSSVLVATFYAQHEHHTPSIDLFLRFDKNDACCAAHSLAEIYSVLTGRAGRDRVSGDGALLFLGNVRERLTTIALDPEEYFAALEVSAPLGIAGGGIYDAVLGYCAMKAEAQSIYTWNVKDFQRLGPTIAARVKTP
ncbi:MAG: PIN domain-containing protein [Candidatus Binataceae bacterium]